MRIGFIGLGKMGGPMAANLAGAGYDVAGYDLVAGNNHAAEARGVRIAGSAAECVRGAEAVVTMLPAGEHVLEVSRDVFPLMERGTTFIDSSTIDVASARSMHRHATEHGLLSIDAPVSGGVAGAEAGTLTFMVGGSDDAFQAARPLFEPMAGRVVHCGKGGSGQAAKICNNMLLGISMIGVSEAFVLAERLGLSHQALFDVASTSSGRCWSLETYCPVPDLVPASPANRDYEPGFAVSLMLKDLRLAQDAAAENGAQTPLGALAAQLYGLLSAHGEDGRDFSAIIEFLRGQRVEGGGTPSG